MSGLFARSWNEGAAGEPVLLLHGFGACADVWAPIAERLARPAIAYDLAGHRFSDLVEGKSPARETAKGLVADLDARGVARAVLAGHSLGGASALLAAMSAPERFSRLVLFAPGGIGEDISEPLMRALGEADDEPSIRAALRGMMAPGAPAQSSDLASLVAMRGMPAARAGLMRIAAQLSEGGRQGVIPADRLAELPMPVSVLWGTADPVLPFAQTGALPPAWLLEALEGVGHMLLDEAPKRVAAALEAG